jgi:hypothetical protein
MIGLDALVTSEIHRPSHFKNSLILWDGAAIMRLHLCHPGEKRTSGTRPSVTPRVPRGYPRSLPRQGGRASFSPWVGWVEGILSLCSTVRQGPPFTLRFLCCSSSVARRAASRSISCLLINLTLHAGGLLPPGGVCAGVLSSGSCSIRWTILDHSPGGGVQAEICSRTVALRRIPSSFSRWQAGQLSICRIWLKTSGVLARSSSPSITT